jgi:catechol 2,3-dioxygenase-like lactoylglutathione lyase family enzyme
MQAVAGNGIKAQPTRSVARSFELQARRRCNGSGTIKKTHNSERKGQTMKIKLTSVFVDDQEKALKFYTEVLGFQKKHDFAGGGTYRWLTVVSPEDPEGVQLVLEANEGYNPAAKAYQQGIFGSGIPAANFFVGDVEKEHERLSQLGVTFTKGPTKTTGSTIAVLDDTCGNLIQLTHLSW